MARADGPCGAGRIDIHEKLGLAIVALHEHVVQLAAWRYAYMPHAPPAAGADDRPFLVYSQYTKFALVLQYTSPSVR